MNPDKLDTAVTAERAVMVCPQCEGEGFYADGLDESACSTECTRCASNGWIVDVAALAASLPSTGAPTRTDMLVELQRLRKLVASTHKSAATHENCDKENCPICDGGLFICADCGAAEAEAEERLCSAPSTGAGMVRGLEDGALEWAKIAYKETLDDDTLGDHEYVVRAYLAALEPVAVEPVAWRYRDFADGWVYTTSINPAYAKATGISFEPLYTAPLAVDQAMRVACRLLENSLLDYAAISEKHHRAEVVAFLAALKQEGSK